MVIHVHTNSHLKKVTPMSSSCDSGLYLNEDIMHTYFSHVYFLHAYFLYAYFLLAHYPHTNHPHSHYSSLPQMTMDPSCILIAQRHYQTQYSTDNLSQAREWGHVYFSSPYIPEAVIITSTLMLQQRGIGGE